jgi:chromosome segregation protein
MYLSKLEIQGFKSFAQRVSLSFDSGISAIVGPNGCGKTNIVDAIRWVLGEQRYSALRSDKMEDVIFNGTKGRKALGMAEASLVIENTKGILPSEYSQVTVGRRVYRSGESEYLLNKTPCRLKDIIDLFMDTGMGSDAYSVIELKMIETILSDKTDERRRLFEEAAGVTKYKHRRKAAYRKLESVQADLVRVSDIVVEVQKAVSSLERQARKAGQYNEVKARLRALEIDLMEREYAHLHSRMIPLEQRFAVVDADQTRVMTDLGVEEGALEALREAALEAEKRLAEAQRDVVLQREEVRNVEQKNLIAGERIRALLGTIARLDQEQSGLQADREVLEHHQEELKGREQELLEHEEEILALLQSRQEDLTAAEAILEGKKTELLAHNERMIALVQRIAEGQAEQEKRKGRLENLRGQSRHAEEENVAYGDEIQRLEEEVSELTAEDRRHRRAFTEAEMRYYEAENRRNALSESLEALQRQAVELRGVIQTKRARVDFLKGLIETREGLSEGIRYLSSADSWKPVRKLTVGDAIHAEERYRAAIEAALGEAANLLVVDHLTDAREGIALLKREGKGKVSFVSLDGIPEIESRQMLPAVRGVIGWALDLATFPPEYAGLFRLLLDRVLVVDVEETAMALARSLAGVRCVTLHGEVISGVGISRGGSKRQDEGGTIGKHRQIEDLLLEIGAAERTLADLARSRDQLLSEQSAIDLKSLTETVKEIEREMTGVEMRIAQLEFEKKRASDIIARNAESSSALALEMEELERTIAGEEPRLSRLSEEKSEIERAVGAGTQALASLEEGWNVRSTAVNEAGIAQVNLRNDLRNLRADLERTIGAIQENTVHAEVNRRDIDLARKEIEATRAAMRENDLRTEELRKGHEERTQRQRAVEEESARLRSEAHQRELRIKDQRRTHEETLRLGHELELKIQDLKAKGDHLRQRALEEFEVVLELKSYPEQEFVDFAEIRDEIQSLRDRSKTLGNINFAAFEEYTEEKKRYEFLSAQRKDLLEAEKTLLATIEEINATAQKKFLDTFALIRTNFIETFKSLFDPGDECDLRLEDGVDPLEAGIDIVAKPRGKRPTSIDLLSGGEKTLTAIALLFAIYLVKPSPFCILDEVDAPLDDANIDRFTRILDKFSDNTQFIVVTHNKRTMEAANALYGVTMEEEGVSKLVTVRFNQQSQVASAAVVSA